MDQDNGFEVCISVDTEALRRDYPNGVGQGSTVDLAKYFTVLVDKKHRYDDPDDTHDTGILCETGETMYFRAIPQDGRRTGVIILEFADRATGSDKQIADTQQYLSPPIFRTNEFTAPVYDNSQVTQLYSHPGWGGWYIWNAVVKEGACVDPYMTLFANRDTVNLDGGHIRYTLGFQVYYADCTLNFYFDPYIKILRRG